MEKAGNLVRELNKIIFYNMKKGKIIGILIFLLSVYAIFLNLSSSSIANKISEKEFDYINKSRAGHNFVAKNDVINIVCSIDELPNATIKDTSLFRQAIERYYYMIEKNYSTEQELNSINTCNDYYDEVEIDGLKKNNEFALATRRDIVVSYLFNFCVSHYYVV